MFSFSNHTRLSFSAETPPLLSASNYEQINSTTLSYSKGGYHTGADTKTISIIQPWIPLTNWLIIHLLLFIPIFRKNSSNCLNNKYIRINIPYRYFVVLDKATRRKTKIKNQLAVHVFLTFKNTENRLLQQRQNTHKYQRQSGSLCHFHTHQHAKNSTESTSKTSNHKTLVFHIRNYRNSRQIHNTSNSSQTTICRQFTNPSFFFLK